MFNLLIIGFNQPDEDDYGYVSKDAMAIYNNIMNKYVNTPADSRNVKTPNHRSHDISGTKVCNLARDKNKIKLYLQYRFKQVTKEQHFVLLLNLLNDLTLFY